MAPKKTRDSKVFDLETDTHTCSVSVELQENGHTYATMLDDGGREKRFSGIAMRKPEVDDQKAVTQEEKE